MRGKGRVGEKWKEGKVIRGEMNKEEKKLEGGSG